MSETLYRPLSFAEKAILDRLLAHDFCGRDELAQQIVHSSVRQLDDNGSLEFCIESSIKADAVRARVPTEGEAVDSDGVIIHFLLHVVNNRVAELEIFKEDNSMIKAMPSADAIQVFTLQ